MKTPRNDIGTTIMRMPNGKKSAIVVSLPSTVQLAPGCCSASSPCAHQKNWPDTICGTCQLSAVTSTQEKSP